MVGFNLGDVPNQADVHPSDRWYGRQFPPEPCDRQAERQTAAAMIGDLARPWGITLGADKLYDTRTFIAEMRSLGVTPLPVI